MLLRPKFGRKGPQNFFGGACVNRHHFRPTGQVWLRSHGWTVVKYSGPAFGGHKQAHIVLLLYHICVYMKPVCLVHLGNLFQQLCGLLRSKVDVWKILSSSAVLTAVIVTEERLDSVWTKESVCHKWTRQPTQWSQTHLTHSFSQSTSQRKLFLSHVVMWRLSKSRSKSRFLGKSNGMNIVIFWANMTRFRYRITLEGPAIGSEVTEWVLDPRKSNHSAEEFISLWIWSRRVWRSLYLQLQIKYWGKIEINLMLDFYLKIELKSNRVGKNAFVTSLIICCMLIDHMLLYSHVVFIINRCTTIKKSCLKGCLELFRRPLPR